MKNQNQIGKTFATLGLSLIPLFVFLWNELELQDKNNLKPFHGEFATLLKWTIPATFVVITGVNKLRIIFNGKKEWGPAAFAIVLAIGFIPVQIFFWKISGTTPWTCSPGLTFAGTWLLALLITLPDIWHFFREEVKNEDDPN